MRTIILLLTSFFSLSAFAEKIDGTPFEQYITQSKNDNHITYYLSESKADDAPLLLMIQGSGCNRVITKNRDGVYSSIFNLLKIANSGKFTVLAVEKPNSGLVNAKGGNVAHSCSKEFHDSFTVESWVEALNLAIKETLLKLKRKPKQILLFGFSEGAGIASQVAATNHLVTHVITSGGSGTSQMFDFVAFAYKNCFERSKCIDDAYLTLENILKEPDSSTKFAWGHPYKRWSSFFRLDPAENLLKSNAKVYLVFGTSDTATPAISQEIIAAKLKSAGRDITIRRLPNASHSFQSSRHQGFDQLDNEHRLSFKWFWDDIAL